MSRTEADITRELEAAYRAEAKLIKLPPGPSKFNALRNHNKTVIMPLLDELSSHSRTITSHQFSDSNALIEISPNYEPGGPKCNSYVIEFTATDGMSVPAAIHIPLHRGYLDEGLKGVTLEALLALVQHHLLHYQTGKLPCKENADAYKHVTYALDALARRAARRTMQGMAGKPVERTDA